MLDSSFLFPQYEGRNFANIPVTIQYWLTGHGAPALSPDVLGAHTGRYDLVILFFIDSFGWEFIERYADEYAFLKHLTQHGRISKITSQFPSTTAAHVTCIHTGLPVGQSGIFEWAYYEPRLDAMITPLLFSYAGMTRRDELKKAGVDPKQLYPSQTIYEPLAAHGVKSHTFGSREFTPSTFSNIVMRGAQLHPFWSLSDSMVNLAAQALDTPLPAYIFFYYGTLDAISHSYGPHSRQTHAELDLLLTAMDRWFLRLLRGKLENALFVMTADHGQAAVAPQNTRYLNLDANLKKIIPMLRRDGRGEILPPGGSPRDAFLYIRDEAVDEAYTLLKRELDGYADVVRTSDLIQEGYFGKLPVCAELLGRLGDIAILPYSTNCVWWYEEGKFEQKYYGHHGGLTPAEAEIPLALLELSA